MGLHDSASHESLAMLRQEEGQLSSVGERGFLQRVGKSIKRMFGCVNRSSRLDLAELHTPAITTTTTNESEDVKPAQAHSWITQQTAPMVFNTDASFYHTHHSLVIDLPPALNKPLLPDINQEDAHKKCLILDLDETLVHSSFLPVPSPDYVLHLPLDPDYSDHVQSIYVCKRPGVDVFLDRVTRLFEVVLFTASLSNYADPVINFLDPERRIRHRLYREDCVLLQGLYIKDLSRLGRPLERCAIVDNSPASYLLQPQCAIAIKSWFNDPDDRELCRLLPSLNVLASGECSVMEWRNACTC